MKRLIATILATVTMFALSSAFAQGLTGGAKVGLNIAGLSGSDAADYQDSKMGFCIGGFVTYSFLDMVAIQPELLFTMKGGKGEVTITETTKSSMSLTTESSMSLSYLEIPVLAKLTMPAGIVKPVLLIGPALSIKMGKVKVEVDGESLIEENGIKGVDFGLVFGAGADFAFVVGKLGVEARYTFGLTSIDDTPEEDGGPFDIKNGVISIMAGYSYSF